MKRALVAALLLAACSNGAPVPEQLAVPDDAAARELVETFFTAYVDVKTRDLVEMMCERDPQTRAMAESFIRQSQSPKSPFRVERFRVAAVEPGWSSAQSPAPLFWVTVAFPRNSRPGEIEQRVRVNASDGCIARFLTGGGPSSAPAKPDFAPDVAPAPEPAVPDLVVPEPPPANDTAPVGADDDVIEL